MLVRLALACVAVIGCTDEPLVPAGPHYQYVVHELHIPATYTEARGYALDLNGDRTVDNQLGSVFAALNGNGLGVGDTAREAVLRGGLIMLADVQTTAFEDGAAAGIQTALGSGATPAPCTDPMNVETCGQHLLGTGVFTVEDGSASDVGVGRIEAGVLFANIDRLPVKIALVNPETPIHVVLRRARVKLTNMSPSGASAVIAGGITRRDVDEDLIPEAASQMDRIVTRDCDDACVCITDSNGDKLRRWFDANHDCRIDSSELATNTLIQSLITPDLNIEGEQLLSFGVGVELTSATF